MRCRARTGVAGFLKEKICFSKGKIPGTDFQLKSAFGEKYGKTIDDRVAARASGTQNDLSF
jgi:hypothetical protein